MPHLCVDPKGIHTPETNYTREHLAMIEQGRRALFGDHKPTDVLVGVASLANTDYLIEVDAIAVVEEECAIESPN